MSTRRLAGLCYVWGRAVTVNHRRQLLQLALSAGVILVLASGGLAAQDSGDDITEAISTVFDQHSAIMLLINPSDGAILRANQAAERFYGYPERALRQMSIQEINSLTPDQVRAEMELARSEAREYFVFRHRLASGELRTVEVRSSPLRWQGRESLLSVVTDVTDRVNLEAAIARQQQSLEETIATQTGQMRRASMMIEIFLGAVALGGLIVAALLGRSRNRLRRAETELADKHQRLENVIDATGIGTWEWHVPSGSLKVNETFLNLLGLHRERQNPQSIDALAARTHADDREAARNVLIAHLKDETPFIEDELRVAHADGHWVWLRIRGGVIRRANDGRATLLAGATRDVTQTRNSKDHLYQLANYDTLTGLPNRTALLERLREAIGAAERDKRRLGLAFIDLDDFKPINDRYGHAVGDEVLIRVGKRMLSVMRESDTLARIGGDEFVALIHDIDDDESQVHGLFKRLLSAASEPMAIGKETLQVAASIGTTRFPQAEPVDADQLLRQADQAMYIAKTTGKNSIRSFDVQRLQETAARRRARSEVFAAMEDRHLVLHYQPKVHMRSGRLLGAEALLRWKHPVRGMLSPGEFLPLIDNPADMTRLGEWVLESALQQHERWREAGFDCPVSVNIDVRQFRRPEFTAQLANLLGRFPALTDGALELEILETGALEEDVLASGTLRRCSEMGVRISLDDFGTGFSSLSYLKSVPADCLKIDRSFVQTMLDDPHDLSIIKGVLGLAQAFNREAVAEGVCNEDVGTMLLRLGCEFAQGYAVAPAMPGPELPAWHAGWRPPQRWIRATRLPREEHLLLFAQVEMSSLTKRITAYLDGIGATPALPSKRTGLGSWLRGAAARTLRNEPEIFALQRCHERLQNLVAELRQQSTQRTARDIFADLRECSVQAQGQLDTFIERDALQAIGGHLRLVGGSDGA